METKNTLKLAVSDKADDLEIGPAHVPLSLLGEFQQQVSDFLKGSSRDVDPSKVMVSVESGSLAFVASGLKFATHLWSDIDALERLNSLASIDSKRARIITSWQQAAKANPNRKYRLADTSGEVVLNVTAESNYYLAENVWIQGEKYLLGVVTDMGGTSKPNIHVRIDGRNLKVAATKDQLAASEKNRLYREELLHVSAEENILSGELRNIRLIAFQSYKPTFDEAEFDSMVERGTQTWSQVGDDWLESFRNGST